MTAPRRPGRAKGSMERASRRRPSYVVGLGGSAGGLEAFQQFFASTPADSGMAFVLVTHLDPDHKALLAELVQRTTAMPVREAEDGVRLASDSVYVIPPNSELVLSGEQLVVTRARRRGPRAPIDAFLRSLAHERGPTAIGVILSGMGDDGAAGLRAIHEGGGTTLVEDPARAAFDAMPRAAIAASPVDAVAAPELLPARIAALAGRHPRLAPRPAAAAAPSEPLARVLELLRRRTGHDLGMYKPSTIERRLERRLAVHRLDTLDAYADYLERNPEEAELLLRELLIGVTRFFRDEHAFAVLRDEVLPARLADPRARRTVRAWVAGCSSGEEAYSLAITIHEALQHEHAQDVGVQIYATDIDKSAIAVARAGRYDEGIEQDVSPERLARFFVREEGGYRIQTAIRETVVFAEHDLTVDPPFTRLDIVCCRNVLIYMQPALQQRLLPRFHYALSPGGVLVLGSSETASAASALFAPVDAQAKVFRRIEVPRGPAPGMSLASAPRTDLGRVRSPAATAELTVVEAARRVIIDSIAPPTVVINARGDILYASRRTGRYLEPPVGKTNLNIFAMAREGLGPHLGRAVRQAVARKRRVAQAGVEVRGERGHSLVDLAVVPIEDPPSLRGLLLVVFEETRPAPKPRAVRKAGGRSRGADLERELARTRAHLQTVVREMEASQTQVEATNEELQSANEELQSTNEEVTTSKEELQSLNEELMTLNAELVAKNEELGTANDDLRNLLNSTKIPTLFLDNGLRIKRFTSEATRIANVIAGDVGRAITDITLKIDHRGLAADISDVLDSLVSKEVQVVGADGARYAMRIHPYRTIDNRIDGVVITFFDVSALRQVEEALAARAHDSVIARLLDRWPGMVYVRDLVERRDVYLNDRARAQLRSAAGGETSFEALIHPEDVAATSRWREQLGGLAEGEVLARHIRLRSPDGVYHCFLDRESVLARSPHGAPVRVLAVLERTEDDRR